VRGNQAKIGRLKSPLSVFLDLAIVGPGSKPAYTSVYPPRALGVTYFGAGAAAGTCIMLVLPWRNLFQQLTHAAYRPRLNSLVLGFLQIHPKAGPE